MDSAFSSWHLIVLLSYPALIAWEFWFLPRHSRPSAQPCGSTRNGLTPESNPNRTPDGVIAG
ncbi:hypothetical protein JF66_16510 [Cryobacterium sp. MLB-32]|nr:hypothetical protein JF66_16510 [Cryobacterium sp. MLB-32]